MMKNMILASNDSLFLVNNNLFFKRLGYNVINANDYIHAINNIKNLADTNERINTLVVKARSFNEDDKAQLHKIMTIDDDIMIIVLSDNKGENEKNVHFIDYYASPMDIVKNLEKN